MQNTTGMAKSRGRASGCLIQFLVLVVAGYWLISWLLQRAQMAGNAATHAANSAPGIIDRWAQSKDPTATPREIVQRASAATQEKINECLRDIAHGSEVFRSRMPACANSSGNALEQCIYHRVLYDDEAALAQAYGCSRHYQDEVDTLGKTSLYVLLKSQICGIGQWVGLEVCRQ